MVDWRASSVQIVAALIGSGLIVTGLTSLSSYFTRPALDIYVEVGASDNGYLSFASYRIFLVNNGFSTAKDVRLTMTYPNATVTNATMIYQNENFTLNKNLDSVVAFSPRLSTGVKIGIVNNITGREGPTIEERPLQDFGTDSGNYFFDHTDPFSITVTHDEGGNTYRPPPTFNEIAGYFKMYFNPDALKFFIPIVIGILLVGIAYRHKRKSLSKFASDVLKDIETAEKRLAKADSKAIIPFKNYEFNIENELQLFDNYEYYKLIDEFYTGLKLRESKILNPNLSNLDDVLKEENQKCFNLATSAHANIDWKKFHKFDLILLIPSVVLGSYFITLICEGVPMYLYSFYLFASTSSNGLIPIFAISIMFMLRTIGTFFIMRLILLSVQGPSISVYLFPRLTRKRKFFIVSAAIMGFPSLGILILPVVLVYAITQDLAQYQLQTQIFVDYSTIIIIVFDILRMLLLTWIVSKHPRTRKKETIVQSKKTVSE
jgi:hypothetical protein